MNRLLLLQVTLVACFFSTHAQMNVPLPADTAVVRISLDEYGKGTLPGFALINGKKYTFHITVAKPEKQHEAFLKTLAAKLEATYDALDFGPYRQFYLHLWGSEVDLLKNELLDLANILKGPNPRDTLAARAATDFPHLLQRDFLLHAIFDGSFKVSNNITNLVQRGPYNAPQQISINNRTITEDTFRIQVFVADFEKQFIDTFYKASKAAIQAQFPKRVQKFYYEMDQLQLISNSMDSLLQVMAQQPGQILCDTNIYERYQQLIRAYDGHAKVADLKSNWMKTWVMQWIWLDPGNIALNPIGFTDEDQLPFRNGYDTLRARIYNQFRDSAIAYMLHTPQLSGPKMDYVSFDSLLYQKGRGAEKFDFRVINEGMKSTNKTAAEQKQLFWNNINHMKFAVVEADKKDQYVYRHFDAATSLKGTTPDDGPAISNKMKVSVAVYNLKGDEDLSMQEKPVEIKNESAAITQLNQAGDLLSGLMGGANPLPQILSTFVKSYRAPDPVPSPAVITLKNSEKSGGVIDPYINDVKLLVAKSLRENNLKNCELIKNVMYDTIVKRPEVISRIYNTDSNEMGELVRMILQGILVQYNITRLANELLIRQSVLDLMASPKFYTLPPRKIEPARSKVSQYRNDVRLVNEETKAMKKNLELVVTNLKTGKEVSRKKDSYKTAPASRITASIGITWVMSPFARNEMKVDGGVISGKTDDEQLRIMAGIHYHLAPMIQADDRIIFKTKGQALRSRFSVFAGVSFPKPFYNLHPGVAVDIFPGVKIVTTAHFYRFTNYTLMNGQITDEKSKMVYNGITTGISLEPLTFIKLIGIIK